MSLLRKLTAPTRQLIRASRPTATVNKLSGLRFNATLGGQPPLPPSDDGKGDIKWQLLDDYLLIRGIQKHGLDWESLAKYTGKTEKQCMRRVMATLYDWQIMQAIVDVEGKIEGKLPTKAAVPSLAPAQMPVAKTTAARKANDVERLMEKAAGLTMPPQIKEQFDYEISKLASLNPNQNDYSVLVTYLDWLTSVPFGTYTKDNLDIKAVSEVLEREHFGMRGVKERILEFVSVAKMRQSSKTQGDGKILLLVGPPGVGKTSIAKSIANALGRNFHNISVGGISDTSEIKGHRRTYVGALPGLLVQAMKRAGSMNPVISIDEIDKLGRGRGDPASALLGVLDPSQNKEFVDQYLSVPLDLSQVLFVCTANSLDSIPGPLLDRCEIIGLNGYVTEEKVTIAKKYLIPKIKKDMGLEGESAADAATAPTIAMEDAAIEALIQNYCRESGVRNLGIQLDKIYRKVLLQHFRTPEKKEFSVTAESLSDYLGPAWYDTARIHTSPPSGVANGLAYTMNGGSMICSEMTVDEAVTEHSVGKVRFTGQMGHVMRESVAISLVAAKSYLAKNIPENTFLQRASIHLHMPKGAVSKEGPSAGCLFTTSFLSLALDKPVPAHIAMTGEISLLGKVLPVGGLREKLMAAQRDGAIKTVIVPKQNQKEIERLPESLRRGLKIHFVEDYSEVFDIVFKQ